MKDKKLKQLESRLIQALQSRFGDPESEAPMTLRDQPTEIVFTALQPKRKPEGRQAMFPQPDRGELTMSGEPDPLEGVVPDGPSGGEEFMAQLLGPEPAGGGQDGLLGAGAPEGAAQPTREPAAATGSGQNPVMPRSEEDMMQDLLVMG